MTVELVGKVRSTLQNTDHPYMQGAWRPTFNEWNVIFASGDAEVVHDRCPHKFRAFTGAALIGDLGPGLQLPRSAGGVTHAAAAARAASAASACTTLAAPVASSTLT